MNLSRRYTSIDSQASKKVTDDLIAWLRSFFSTRVNSRLIDERRTIPPHIVMAFARKGLMGFHIEEQYGGLGLNCVDSVRLIGQLGALDATISQLVAINALAIRPVMSFGSQEMKDKYLPSLAKGEFLCAFAQTEESAGTNFTKMKTRSSYDDVEEQWTINGDKYWIGNAGWSEMMVLTCQAYDSDNKSLGLNSFLVSTDSVGIDIGVELNTMGLRGVVQNKLKFNNLKLENNALIGKKGDGVMVGVDAMSYTRIVISAQQIGLMKKAILTMHGFVSQRIISTGKLIENPIGINALSECCARVILIDKLVNKVATSLDQDDFVFMGISSLCKIISTEFAGYVTDKSLQLLGGRGYEENNILPQLVRDARVTRIFEGPTEALLCFVGSRIKIDGGQRLFNSLFDATIVESLMPVIKSMIEEIKQASSEIELTNIQRMKWIEYKVGLVGSWAILKLISIETLGLNNPISKWVSTGYSDFPKLILGDCFLPPHYIQKTIDSFVQDIGIVEQSSPALNWEKDKLVTSKVENKYSPPYLELGTVV